MPRDEAVLLDVAGAARLVLEFRHDMDKAAFFEDVKTQSAILHQSMVMGAARGGRRRFATPAAPEP